MKNTWGDFLSNSTIHIYLFLIIITIMIILMYISIVVRKINNKLIDCIFYTIIPLVVVAILIYIFGYYAIQINNWLFDSQNDSFTGSFVGGVLGGILALIIAKYQIYLHKKEQISNERKEINGILISLKTEMNINISLLDKIIEKMVDNNGDIIKMKKIMPIKINTWEIVKLSSLLISQIEIDTYNEISEWYYQLEMLKSEELSLTIIEIKGIIESGKNIIEKI